ncbi:MAG TPA: nuclear transport factor 2 family protein [Sphingomonas sp.]|nr:nuclear transport factor 2 family protein [Sphingomonas sp.]
MDLLARLGRLEAEAEIRRLIARYCFAIDNRDLAEIRALFADDARVASEDGVMEARGLDAIMAQYRGRFSVLGPGAHYMHDVSLAWDDASDHATGRVSGHAELWRNDQMMVASLRYRDRYVRTAADWRFAERIIGFLYYVPVAQYPGILGTRDRNRAYADPLSADFPEALPSWRDYGG